MREEYKIKNRLNELNEVRRIANGKLIMAIESGEQQDIVFWERSVAELSGQIYGIMFAMGKIE